MASFFSKFFGGGGAAKRGGPVPYQGLTIQAVPEPAGDRWRLAGVISKQGGDGTLERSFMRADTFPSREEAESFAIRKGKQIIDEQGEKLFADGAPSGRV